MKLVATAVTSTMAIVVAAIMCSTAQAQNFPSKPIRILTAAAGGGHDLAARLIAQGLSVNLGQQVIVDNRGGTGVIAADIVSKAPPDGYNLILYGSDLWTLQFMHSVPWDVTRDFTPITLAVTQPGVIVAHPSLPVTNVKELIALARAKPGQLDYATGAAGSSTHLSAELFRTMTGIKVVRIAYKGSGPALNALVSGQVQYMFGTPGPIVQQIKAGRLRGIAVTSKAASPLLPGLPPVSAAVPGYEAVGIIGLFAPAKTPASIIEKLNQETVKVLNQPEIKERFFNAGVEVTGSSPEVLATAVKAEMVKWGKVIKDSGITAE